MADIAVNDLESASNVQPADLLVLWQYATGTARKIDGQAFVTWLTGYADGHGGIVSIERTARVGLVDTYTIAYADENIDTFTVTNGAKGDTGDQTYVHIKWASQEPTADNQLSDIPDDWIGIYSGLSSTAPTSYGSYSWFKYKGETGDTGDSIESVTLVETGGPGENNVYAVNLESGNVAGTFSVKNGRDGQGAPSDSDPLMDGTASAGSAQNFSRSDHVHPTDTSRAAVNTHRMSTYTSVSQLGLTQGSATLAGAYAAMPDKSLLIAEASQFLSTELPTASGTVEIAKAAVDGARGWVEFHGKSYADGDYRMFINNSNQPVGSWMPTTEEDFTSLLTHPNGDPAHVQAVRKGNMCFLSLQSASRTWASQDVICTLPSGYVPSIQRACSSNINANAAVSTINTNGSITIAFGSGSGRVYINCCWPLTGGT